MVYTNCLTSCRRTITKYQENLKMSHNDNLVPSLPAKTKFLLKLATNLKNRNQTFLVVRYSTLKLKLISKTLSMIVENYFRFIMCSGNSVHG